MDPSDIAFVKAVVIGIVGIGTALSVYGLRLRHRLRGPSEVEHERELAAQREDAELQRAAFEARLVELEERLDFAERRLIQEREGRRLDRPATTPV